MSDEFLPDEVKKTLRKNDRTHYITTSFSLFLGFLLYLFDFSFWWFPSIIIMLDGLMAFLSALVRLMTLQLFVIESCKKKKTDRANFT